MRLFLPHRISIAVITFLIASPFLIGASETSAQQATQA